MAVSNSVYLSGGLGNQLFQIAAAVSKNNLSKVNVIWSRTHTKLLEGQPAIFSLRIEPLVYNSIEVKSKLKIKLLSLLIRNRNCNGMQAKLIRKITSYLMLSKINYANVIQEGNWQSHTYQNNLLVGYFQSTRYLDSAIKDLFKNLFLDSADLINSDSIQNSNLIHFRRGDYRLEKEFGLLGYSYYQSAFSKIEDLEIDGVSIFSDEIEYAMEYFKINFPALKIISGEKEGESIAQTFYRMIFYKNYVIANSSLSWWAAFLRFNESGKVIAPEPWFQYGDIDTELVPSEWVKIKHAND